jgi:spermidine/putrescine transport system substrate-binding protein
MLVPNLAAHKTNAEELMNFYYQPTIAAQLAAWNYYFCPVQGAQQEMHKFDKSAVNNPLIFPDQQMLSHGYTFMGLTDKQEQSYQAQFNAAQSA